MPGGTGLSLWPAAASSRVRGAAAQQACGRRRARGRNAQQPFAEISAARRQSARAPALFVALSPFIPAKAGIQRAEVSWAQTKPLSSPRTRGPGKHRAIGVDLGIVENLRPRNTGSPRSRGRTEFEAIQIHHISL